ncbi:hypothetical protein EW146_g1071 [Bondarzewia mesenterica]|uniref:DUF7582 domain-containing protein n=1 Tax=Bondarzewia mesenterica TaxID=1095465 RepID=A0A4S4M776_9AGAM|nr:hypothetical protein EW146_g1071 [Bondarzewia mesenterica]
MATQAKENFTQQDIETGLTFVSQWIQANAPSWGVSLPLTALAVGGVLSVLHFHNRSATKDVDFYHADSSAVSLLTEAAEAASNTFKWRNSEWLNADVSHFIDTVLLNSGYSVYTDALHQNVVIWEAPEVLTLVAAPWRWQLFNKLTRLMSFAPRREDLIDAVSLLHMICVQERRALTKEEIFGWGYSRVVLSVEVLAIVQKGYRDRYGETKIAIDGL